MYEVSSCVIRGRKDIWEDVQSAKARQRKTVLFASP